MSVIAIVVWSDEFSTQIIKKASMVLNAMLKSVIRIMMADEIFALNSYTSGILGQWLV
ncbi:hypothetical protein PULV_b0331 [Pseudoalteromonas ulvae UL12]|nr:hypothetical protein [Pseudoalteromonas ulvae UL12]